MFIYMDVMNLIPWTHFAKISETMKLQIQGPPPPLRYNAKETLGVMPRIIFSSCLSNFQQFIQPSSDKAQP